MLLGAGKGAQLTDEAERPPAARPLSSAALLGSARDEGGAEGARPRGPCQVREEGPVRESDRIPSLEARGIKKTSTTHTPAEWRLVCQGRWYGWGKPPVPAKETTAGDGEASVPERQQRKRPAQLQRRWECAGWG